MALQLEMSQGGYGKIERGETDITLSKIDTIAKVLWVTISMILDFDDKIFFNINQNSNESALAGVIFENKSPESEKIHYESQIEQQKERIVELKEEILHLREEVTFLRNFILKT